MRLFFGVTLLALLLTVAHGDPLEQNRKLEVLSLKVPEHLNFSRTLEGKTFKLSYEPRPSVGSVALVAVPLREMHSWRVAVLDRQGKPVRHAKLTVEGTMP